MCVDCRNIVIDFKNHFFEQCHKKSNCCVQKCTQNINVRSLIPHGRSDRDQIENGRFINTDFFNKTVIY